MRNLNSTSPEEMYVALQIGFYGGQELLEWLRTTTHLDEYASDWEVSELFCANKHSARNVEQSVKRYTRVYGRYWKETKVPSDQSEKITKRLFAERLREYLNDECKPNDICELFSRIESLFDFPEWLGDMYNACDWVQRETASSDCPYLGEEAARLLPTLLDPK